MVFVGRNTRQKGVPYLLRAAAKLPADVQLVLCLGAADTPELAAETARLIEELQSQRSGVVLIERMLPRNELIQVLSHATAFACPSIYEPLGIVNLEAMACGAAVVASATGGIPEVVNHGETGLLVELEQVTDGTGTPLDPEKFVSEFAAALTEVVSDPGAGPRHGPGRPPACGGALLLGIDHPDYARRLPLGPQLARRNEPPDQSNARRRCPLWTAPPSGVGLFSRWLSLRG